MGAASDQARDWDFLIWILYDRLYRVQEAWLWEVAAYRASVDSERMAGRLPETHISDLTGVG